MILIVHKSRKDLVIVDRIKKDHRFNRIKLLKSGISLFMISLRIKSLTILSYQMSYSRGRRLIIGEKQNQNSI